MTRLLFVADGGQEWIGGLYYVRNVLHSVLEARKDKSITIIVLVSNENADLFRVFERYDGVAVITVPTHWLKGRSKYRQFLTGRNWNETINEIVNELEINFIFPVTTRPFQGHEDKCIFWIPDFQYCYYPEYFSARARMWKRALAKSVAQSHAPIILSSKSAEEDYLGFFADGKEQLTAVVHFVSFLEPYSIKAESIRATKRKYGICGKYFTCCNQFWPHKNHRVVIEALADESCNGINMVFSGNPNGGDGGSLYRELQDYACELGVANRTHFLGYLDRREQLDLMVGSTAVVQPSLFEGWGTVLEDAKALGKQVLLSDIPVHREQMNADCMLFQPDSPQALAKLMATLSELNDHECKKLDDDCAEEYGQSFLAFVGKLEKLRLSCNQNNGI